MTRPRNFRDSINNFTARVLVKLSAIFRLCCYIAPCVYTQRHTCVTTTEPHATKRYTGSSINIRSVAPAKRIYGCANIYRADFVKRNVSLALYNGLNYVRVRSQDLNDLVTPDVTARPDTAAAAAVTTRSLERKKVAAAEQREKNMERGGDDDATSWNQCGEEEDSVYARGQNVYYAAENRYFHLLLLYDAFIRIIIFIISRR